MTTDPTPHPSLSPDVRERIEKLLDIHVKPKDCERDYDPEYEHPSVTRARKALSELAAELTGQEREQKNTKHYKDHYMRANQICASLRSQHAQELAKVREELATSEGKRKETAKDFETAFRVVRLENDQLRTTLSAVEAERDALKELWEDAPHGEGCQFIPPLLRTELQDCAGVCECTCWKSEVKLPTDSIEK